MNTVLLMTFSRPKIFGQAEYFFFSSNRKAKFLVRMCR